MYYRTIRNLIWLLAFSAPLAPLAAQGSGWYLGALVAWSDFSGGARGIDNGVTLEPSSRLHYGLTFARRAGPWRLELATSWAPGHLSSRDSTGNAVQIDVLNQSYARLQFGLLAGRRLITLGGGEVGLSAGPVASIWSGQERIRPRLGGQLQLSLSAPMGRFELRNYVGWAVEGSLFDEDEAGPSVERRTVTVISLGMQLGWKL